MRRFISSVRHAVRGLRHVFSYERNFRIETVVGLGILAVSFLFPLSVTERAAVFLTVGTVLAFETLNSAVEWLMDVLQPEYHDSVKIVKDLTAAAVLVVSIFAAFVGVVVFTPYIIAIIP